MSSALEEKQQQRGEKETQYIGFGPYVFPISAQSNVPCLDLLGKKGSYVTSLFSCFFLLVVGIREDLVGLDSAER